MKNLPSIYQLEYTETKYIPQSGEAPLSQAQTSYQSSSKSWNSESFFTQSLNKTAS